MNWIQTGDQTGTRLQADGDKTGSSSTSFSSSSSSCHNLKPWLVARPLFYSEAADWSSHKMMKLGTEVSDWSGNFPSFCLRKKLSGFNSQNPSVALLCCFLVVVVLSFFFPRFFSLCCFQRDSKCPGVVLTLLPYRTCPPGGQADSGGGRGERGRGSSVSLKLLVETSAD